MSANTRGSQPPEATFVELLRWRALHHPDKIAYTFLLDGETREERRTYAELDEQARHIAALLQERLAPGDRVLLLYPPGLEYIAAIFGCWYAGVIAVPAYPPRPNQHLGRIEVILQDADAHAALTTAALFASLQRKFTANSMLQRLHWIVPEKEHQDLSERWREYIPLSSELALLQYTSGSTGIPRGVMVDHDNLLQNALLCQQGMGVDAQTLCVSWLPAYHDMGLMGMILEPVYLGASSILMAPASFLQQPMRWLQAVSRFRANTTGAPNFAFDLCVHKATPEVIASLDLSCLDLAFTGSEPVQAQTLKRFYETFAPCGLREEALYPCYGMAEATLFISGGSRREPPIVRHFTQESLEHSRPLPTDESATNERQLVSCGRAQPEQCILIVDPVALVPCAPRQVGEIWVASPNVARGYWRKPQETAETFQAFLQDEGPFLRTGDLGFLSEGELFVTGRLKDLIILHGRNIYPQDIEAVVSNCHPALRPGSCAAFSLARGESEGLVLVQEVDRHYQNWDIQEIIQAVLQAVSREFEVGVSALELVKIGGVAKTSSGKTQRYASRQAFLEHTLPTIQHWTPGEIPVSQQSPELSYGQDAHASGLRESKKSREDIVTWLRVSIAERAHLDPQSIHTDMPFVSFGLNSIDAINLSGELEQWLGHAISPTIIYDYPSIEALAGYLAVYVAGEHARANASVQDETRPDYDAVAIIGLGCRFPGAENPEAFWKLLATGEDAISEVPSARWNSADFYAPEADIPHKMNTRQGGFLAQVDAFDSGFFGISAREAEHIDPQQRLLLEVAWETFERAGIEPKELAGSATGVFVGISGYDYALLQVKDARLMDAYAGTGNAHSVAANRLSYTFDLRGPSMAIDTACSSSLVAVHQACQSLRTGECSLALAGGVNLLLTPEPSIVLSQAQMLAPDGRSKTFDAAADGYVRGEGCGLVLLKLLRQALEDGDTVLAVVRGSAVNQDGASNGITAPNGRAQEAVIRQALASAHVSPAQVGYVETHGTGTALGDPIEVQALKTVLMQDRQADQPCLLGAVKTNIGHLEAAAGIAGLIKTVLCLQHQEIPPNLHFQHLNPYIDLSNTPFSIPTEKLPWLSATPRIASVSAFGFGGTNAHVILEEAPQRQHPSNVSTLFAVSEPSHALLTLSAKSADALRQLRMRYQRYLEEQPEISLADLCYTTHIGRTHFAHRTALVARSSRDLAQQLSRISAGNTDEAQPLALPSGAKTVFLFSGQGSHYTGMTRQLYREHPVFRREIDRCEQILQPHLKHSLRSLLFDEQASTLLQETRYTQSALFAIEYALATLWRSWGVEPDLVAGHSVGEYVAACVAGMLSLEEGLPLIATRGRLMQELPEHGAMLAVFSTPARLQHLFEPWPQQISVAALNGPRHVVLAGPRAALEHAVSHLESHDIDTRFLHVSHAFHSGLLAPMQDAFTQVARSLTLQAQHIPLISNLTGNLIASGEVPSPEYWWEQTRNTVQFLTGMQTAYEQGGRVFIEIGPGDTLTRMGPRCLPDASACTWLPSLKQEHDDWEILLGSVAALYTKGYGIDWNAFEAPSTPNRSRLSLPTYPFERQRHWFTDTPSEQLSSRHIHTHVSYEENNGSLMSQNYAENIPFIDALADKQAASPSQQQASGEEQITVQLQLLLGKLLHCSPEEIARTTPFLEMGADSLVLSDAVKTIEQQFGVKLPMRELFGELGTLDGLATYIAQRLPPAFSATQQSATGSANVHPETSPPPLPDTTPVAQRQDLAPSSAQPAAMDAVERVIAHQLDTLSQIMAQQLAAVRQPTGPERSAPLVAPKTLPFPDQVLTPEVQGEARKDDQTSPARYVPYQPLNPLRQEGLTERQQQHLQALTERLTRYTQASKQYAQTYRPVLADNRASIGFRFSIKELLYIIVAQRAQGAYIWDLDGNRLLDFTMGFGVNLFGHNPPFIQQALEQQLAEGFQLGAQSLLAGEVATLIREMTGMERVFYCNSGTEAVMAAVRIARAVSGKDKIVIFSGSYHGTFDGILMRVRSERQSMSMAPGIPEGMAEDVLVLDYGSEQSLAIIREHASELAAVLVEPVQSRHPDVQPRAFLQQLRSLTAEAQVALIFDETITGFRILPGGAQEWFGVRADLATYGKIIGGGMPIGIVAGTAHYMDSVDGGMWQYGDRSYPQAETTIFGGTFSKHPLTLAAARAVLLKLKQEGAVLQERLNARTARMAATLNTYFAAEHVPITCIHFGSLFRFFFTQNMDIFFYHLLEKGVYIWEGRNCLLSTAHTDEDIAFFIQCVKDSIREMREGGFLPPLPLPPPPDGPPSSNFHLDTRQQSEMGNHQVAVQRERLSGVVAVEQTNEQSIAAFTATFPLTAAQQQLWFACHLGGKGVNAYVERVFLRLRGKLDEQALRAAFQACVDRHEALRTVFSAQGEQQQVLPLLPIDIPLVDYAASAAAEQVLQREQWLQTEAEQGFDLVQGPLLRICLFKEADEQHLLLLSIHHLIADGWSITLLLQEVARYYTAFIRRQTLQLPPPLPYRAYVRWQEQLWQQQSFYADEAYLSALVHDLPIPALEVLFDHPRPAVKTFLAASEHVVLAQGTYSALRLVGQRAAATPYMVLLASYLLWLHRLTGQSDVVVGVPTHGRELDGGETLVGHCANVLPFRSTLNASPTFREYLRWVKQRLLELQEHEATPFSLLERGWLTQQGGLRPAPLSTTFNLDRVAELAQFGAVRADVLPMPIQYAPFDLSVNVTSIGEELSIDLSYDTDLFERETIQRLGAYLSILLRAIIDNPEQIIWELPLLSSEEYTRLVYDWNQTRTAYPAQQCIHQVFEAQVKHTPDAIALCYEEQHLTYAQLNARANQLAHALRRLGIGPETSVGLCLERSLEMVTGLLGILKAGGTYVPLDASYPQERLTFLLTDARIAVLLTQQHLHERLPSYQGQVLCLDTDWSRVIAHQPTVNLFCTVSPDHLAYSMYTSGSTGKPKGVSIPHRGVVRLVKETGYVSLNAAEILLQFASSSFDAATFEIWGSLLNGARLVIFPAQAPSLEQFGAVLRREGITTLWLTAGLFQQIVAEHVEMLGGLRQLLAGGDALSVPHARKALETLTDCRLINGYGPTENTTFTCCYPIPGLDHIGSSVPIGRPIANTQVYVLDTHLACVPVGVPGELYIGGAGLARGYLNRPELTAERFLPHPFSTQPGDRLYRTGDMVCYQADGTLKFLGRNDGQVKLRGFRVESGEVEAVLAGCARVRECVVLVREDRPGDKRLVAYVVLADDEHASWLADLRAFLQERLPAYMLPAAYVPLPALPLTPNGKVDRRALPAPDHDLYAPESATIAPRTPIEEILADLWAEVLSLERVGVEDNFFEVGGHSLFATQVISRIRQLLHIELPLRVLFEQPSIAELAQYIEQTQRHEQGMPPLVPVAREQALPLSFAQERLWFLQQLEPENISYHMPAAFRLSGPLSVRRFAYSLNQIVARHELLRTTFHEEGGKPMQIIAPALFIPLPSIDLSALSEHTQQCQLEQLARQLFTLRFDFETGPLLRAYLVRLADHSQQLLFDMHHIIADGWSLRIIIQELTAFYQALAPSAVSLPALPIQYADYALWQRQCLRDEVLQEHLDYWRGQLDGAPALLNLPLDRPRPALQTYSGATRTRLVPAELLQQLHALSRQEGATLFMTLLAVFQVLLMRYTGEEDLVIGTPVAHRTRLEIEHLIGFFVNTLPLRTDLSGNPGFSQLLERVREVTLQAYAHQDMPFERLIEALQPERSLSYAPLFQVLFVLQNTPDNTLTTEIHWPDVAWQPLEVEQTGTKFDLTLQAQESGQGLWMTLEYNTDLFDATTIEHMLTHWQMLLHGVVKNPLQTIATLPLLTAEEEQQLLYVWCTPQIQQAIQAHMPLQVMQSAEAEATITLHQMFELQAQRTPDALALLYEDEALTYQQVNQRANQLARHLRHLGIDCESFVGLCLERSPDLLIGLLAILKAGGAYVPLDPTLPPERLEWLATDACLSLIVTSSAQRSVTRLLEAGVRLLELDGEAALLARQSSADLHVPVFAEQVAYSIYTSGSTGAPKGVMVTHQNVLRLFAMTQGWYQFQATDIWSLFHSYAFDFSVWEIWGALLYGGCLVIVPYWMSRAPDSFYHMLVERGITVLNQTPSAFQQLIQMEEMHMAAGDLALRLVIFGGEALEPGSLQAWVRHHGDRQPQLVNMYGITETTVHVTYRPLVREDVMASTGSLIGGAIPDLQLYILDSSQQPVPIGVPGELYVGGRGLARGYFQRPMLTAERFLPHPWSRQPGARLYRTGDMVRYRQNGDIEYLGRVDQQVKLRGFRIELGEIEATLKKYPLIQEAVVLAREDVPGDRRLVAYIVGKTANDALVEHELRRYLHTQLPEYMVPGAFVMLAELPLTSNGKVQRRLLPAPEKRVGASSEQLSLARTPLEEMLLGIYRDVLDTEQIGLYDSFFAVGGHSLLATQAISRLRQVLRLELPLRSLFEAPSVAELALHVERILQHEQPHELPPLLPVSREHMLPLSFAQERLWFLQQLEPENISYHMPAAFRLSGPFSIESFDRAFQALMQRHESLRTTFAMPVDQPVQVIDNDLHTDIAVSDLRDIAENMQAVEISQHIREAALCPFDLSRGPLFRVGLFRMRDEEYVFYIVLHHILFDAWSTHIFVRELLLLYTAFAQQQPSPLAPLSLHYADFAAWQRNWLKDEALYRLVDYWTEQLRGAGPLELPTDRPRTPKVSDRGALYTFALPQQLTQEVKALSQREGVTLFMTLLTAFQLVLYRYTGEHDLVVGTDIANRTLLETEEMIGFFVNLLALRLRVRVQETFREALKGVCRMVLDAYAHQHLPFEKLIDALQLSREPDRLPLVNVLFVLQNVPAATVQMPGLAVNPVDIEINAAKFDIALFLAEDGQQLQGSVNYRTDLFDPGSIERLMRHFIVLLQNCIAQPDIPVEALEMFTEEEKEQQLRQDMFSVEQQRRRLKTARRRVVISSAENENRS